MKIRKATKKDIEKLKELMYKTDERMKYLKNKDIMKYLIAKDRAILIAEYKDALIGYIGLKRYEKDTEIKKIDFNNSAAIMWIGVSKEYRKKGVGKRLMFASEKYAKKFKKQYIYLDCSRNLIKFYEKIGYIIVSKYRQNRKIKFVMVKKLK